MFIGPIAVTDFDTIIGIIAVVAWLIIQAVAKSRKSDTSAPPPPPPPGRAGEPVSPQDDLRRFFEELEKNLNQQSQSPAPSQPAAPPPVPPSIPRPVKVQSAVRPHRPARPAPQVRAPQPEAEPVPVQSPITSNIAEPREFNWEMPHEPAAIPSFAIAGVPGISGAIPAAQPRRPRHFRSRETLRQWVVGSEILGKPVGLR